jgi:hypothetical protein
MGLALAVGIIASLFFISEDKPPFKFLELIPLALYYAPFCLFFLAIMLIWDKWFHGNIYTSWLLVAISIIVLITGLYAFPIGQYHGVHLILVSFLGFFLSSADQLVQRFKASSNAGVRE